MVTGIGNYCVRNVVTVSRDAPIIEAAKLMREHHVGALVVIDKPGGNVPVGIVTDRDIVVEVVAAGVETNIVNVADIVQRPLATVNEETSYADTVRLMAQHAVRRMPVVDAQRKLVWHRRRGRPLASACRSLARARGSRLSRAAP